MLVLVAMLLAQVDAGAEAPSPPAEADAPVAEEPLPSFTHRVEMNGYVTSRLSYGRSRWSGLVSTADLPQWLELIELNGQLKVTYSPTGFVYADLSVIGQLGFDYRSADADGFEQYQPMRDAPGVRPLVSLNEVYVLHEFAPWLNVMIGKKRLTWGAGAASNPTDLINVRKDPTDPTFQRAGGWLARLEVPLESSVFTLLFSPQVTESAFGLPYAFVVYPEWDTRNDNEAHYLLAARAYFLIADTDINVMAYFSNKYLDDFKNKVRVGASVSRIFFDTWELHAEVLVQQGSARAYVNHDCVIDVTSALACLNTNATFASRSRLDASTFYPQVLAGLRKTFDDDSFLSVEYLFQADGYRPDEYQDLINAYDGSRFIGVIGKVPAGVSLLFPQSSTDATPSRFSFAPVGKHYAFITFNKPRIRDDFTFQTVLIANLQDLSTLWSPSLAWSATEWLTLSLIGFVPVPGPDKLAATVPSTGKHVTEYGSFPQLFRVLFELRIFY